MAYSGSLVVSRAGEEAVEELLMDLISKHKVGIKEMFDSDCCAVSAGDLVYFPREWWGRIPSYAKFMADVRRYAPEFGDRLRYIEAECLGGKYEGRMDSIASMRTDEMDGTESKRFNWNERLYKIQERKMDRIDKRRAEMNTQRGVDLALKIISALSDAELIKAKEIVDAEYTEDE